MEKEAAGPWVPLPRKAGRYVCSARTSLSPRRACPRPLALPPPQFHLPGHSLDLHLQTHQLGVYSLMTSGRYSLLIPWLTFSFLKRLCSL